MNRLNFIALAVLGVTAAGCTMGPPRNKPIEGLSPTRFEFGATAIGQARDVDYHRAVGSGLIDAPGLREYLGEILKKLLAVAPVTDLPADVHVRATSIYGAESSSDALIYLNYRTLEVIESEDQAAAILAHELAHVILGHPSADIVESMQARLLHYTALGLAVYGTVAQRTGSGADMAKQGAGIMAAEAILLKLNQAVVGPAWIREQESEADLLGFDLLVRAGYDPKAMEDVLDQLRAAELEGADERGFNEKVSTMFKTQWPELIQAGRDEVARRVWDMAIDSVTDWLQRRHPDTIARKELIQKYRATHYADLPPRTPNEQAWHEATRKKDPQTKRVFQSYAKAIEASGRLQQNDGKEALKLATSAATRQMDNHTFIADALYRVRKATESRNTSATQIFDPPIKSKEPAWLAFQEVGFAALRGNKSKQGVATLERGFERLQKPPNAIPALLYAYERTGQKEKAAELAKDCAARFPVLAQAGRCQAGDPHAPPATVTEKSAPTPAEPAWARFIPAGGWRMPRP